MLTISEAFDRILATVAPLDAVALPLADVLGLTLAEDVAAAEDSPPFDKSLMDGYAVRAVDVASGFASLQVIEVVTAGRVPTQAVGPGEATQIMTGAPLPDGADLVVKVEETSPGTDIVQIATKSVMAGTNILRRGTSVRAGDVVLKAGMKLNGSRIGALAELGRAMVRVHRRPTVAVLATGDELVSVDQAVGPGQIRNSNEAMLCAQIEGAGAIPVRLGIASDNREALREKIQWGLRCDMLVLSGGVSAGTLDLVPSELASAGVAEVFHKVELKPGKPVWFGMLNKPVTTMTLDDFLQQLRMIRRMGSLKNLIKMVPGVGSTIESSSQFDPDEDMRRIESIILAMTPDERKHPDNIHGDRLEQIAKECGAEVSDVTRLLTDFKNMALMMEKMAGMGVLDHTKALRKLSVKTQEGQAHHSALLPSRCCVFGLPGNPVSSLVCCELFVKTAIRRLMGQPQVLPQSIPAKLEHDHAARADRPTYHPARLTWTAEGPLVSLVPWHGSSDLCGTVAANAMVFLSGEARQYRAGDAVETIAW